MNKKNINKPKAIFDHKDGVSQRQAAKVFKCHYSFVNKTLMKHTEIRCRKKKTIPKRSEVQRQNIKTRCGHLYRKFKNHLWVIDDESYFTLTHSTINGNDKLLF